LIKPEVTAPGDSICAAKSSEIDTGKHGINGDDICDNSKYHAYSGTSMATPHVSGLAALMKQANPSATSGDIRNAMISTAEPSGQGVNIEGNGRVNGNKAINAICKIKNQWVCNGNILEYRDYYSPGGLCSYKVTQQKNCKDNGSDYICSVNQCVKLPPPTSCTCTAWRKLSQDDDYYMCTVTIWTRTCTPTNCNIQTRRTKACM
jgi:hypothetical protein